MSTFSDRDRTALIVIDVQNDVVAEAYRREKTISNILYFIEKNWDQMLRFSRRTNKC